MRRILFLCVFLLFTPLVVTSQENPEESRTNQAREWPNSWPRKLIDNLEAAFLAHSRRPKPLKLENNEDINLFWAEENLRYLDTYCAPMLDLSIQLDQYKDDYELSDITDDLLASLDRFSVVCTARMWVLARAKVKTPMLYKEVDADELFPTLYSAISMSNKISEARWFRLAGDYDRVVGKHNELVEKYNAMASQYAQVISTVVDRIADNALLRLNQQIMQAPRPTTLNCTSTTFNYGSVQRSRIRCR